MDDQQFDHLTRLLASSSDRRRLLRRGLAALAVGGGLASVDPASAARRGYSGTTSLCQPAPGGGYSRITVAIALVPRYLAAGAVPDNGCCSSSECGSGDDCSVSICNVATGACQSTPEADGIECTPNGQINLCRLPYTCQQGVCQEGIGTFCPGISGGCLRSIGCNPSTGQCEYGPQPDGASCNRGNGCTLGTCLDGACLAPPARECKGNACLLCSYDSCLDSCFCSTLACTGSTECLRVYCDPEVGCTRESINEGGACTAVEGGICSQGVCEAGISSASEQ